MAEARETVQIGRRGLRLEGDLVLPESAMGVVLFAHGSGSSRHSPRNQRVARQLNERRLGTLLLDLLTGDEEAADASTGTYRFDIGLLAGRLTLAADWLLSSPRTAALPVGLFGASTGAAAALVCAAERPDAVSAVVSRGGRADLAGEALERVLAPTLLIVGGLDEVVLGLNREAMKRLRCPNRLEIVPGATHLFEEPDALDQVARLAGDWLLRWTAALPHAARTGEYTR